MNISQSQRAGKSYRVHKAEDLKGGLVRPLCGGGNLARLAFAWQEDFGEINCKRCRKIEAGRSAPRKEYKAVVKIAGSTDQTVYGKNKDTVMRRAEGLLYEHPDGFASCHPEGITLLERDAIVGRGGWTVIQTKTANEDEGRALRERQSVGSQPAPAQSPVPCGPAGQ